MITAVFSDQAKAPLVVSTRGFHRKTRTSTAAVITKWSLDKADADLRSKLEDLPSSRCFETWASYLAAVLPLVKLRVEALQRKCVRRARFMNYMRRDREIDRICQDLCGNQPTIVAFGAANACSTGFGYAPAPQSRLRHRLRHVHGARVCLVDEYKTSQLCCGCGGQLGLVREPGRRAPVWHVKRCSFCRNGRGAPLTRHRDLNAAANILDIYLGLAKLGKRPSGFARPRPGHMPGHMPRKEKGCADTFGFGTSPRESNKTSANSTRLTTLSRVI